MASNNVSAWEQMKAKTLAQAAGRQTKQALSAAAKQKEAKEEFDTAVRALGERENSVFGQMLTDDRMAYRAESRNDNSLWKQTEKDRAELSQYTEKLMKDLNDQLTKYRADNDTNKIAETQKRLTELQKQTDTHWTDRVGNTVVGALKQSGGAYGSAFAVTTEDMLDGGRVNVRGESMDKLSFDKNKALQYTQGVRDKTMALTQSGAADIEQAKKGLGTVGRLAVDTAAGLTQLGTDILIGGATHVGAMPVLAVRAFGGAADQAKMDGASVDQQVAYGLASATVELATEKLFSANIISSKAFGKGAADDLLTGIVAGLEDVASTPNGRALMNRVGTMLTSGLSEGLEEGIAAVVDPIAAKLAYGKDMDWDAKEIGYQVLIGALTGAVTGISGQNTNEYRAKVAGQQIGQSIKDSGNLSGIVRQALHTDKESAAYKKADEIRSRKTPATNQEITELARLTFAQVAKEQAEQTAAVEQAQSADLGQPVVTQTATVLDTGTSAYTALGMKPKRAEAKAKVVQKLINGEQVSLDGMKSLNLTDAKYREVFTQLTGVVFPEGMTNHDQLMNVAKTASEVRNNAAPVSAVAEEPIVPMAEPVIAQDTDQPVAQVSDEVNSESKVPAAMKMDVAADYSAFAQSYRTHRNSEASEAEVAAEFSKYLSKMSEARDREQIVYKGKPVTRGQFREVFRQYNPDADSSVADTLFDRELDKQTSTAKTEAPKDLRHKLSKEVQDVISALEKKLGIRVEITESIRSEKTGQTAEGVSDTGIIRLALDARGELSYDEAVMQVLRHEITHQLKRAVSEDTYNAFAKYVREFDAEFYQTQYEQVSKTYAKQFKGSDEAKKQAAIDDEVIARCAEKLFEDEAFIRMVVGKNRTLAEKIHDIFEKLLKKLNLTGEAKKRLQTKRDLWAAMLNEAEENVKAGVAYDKEAESFHPAQFSLDTWNESDYVAARAEAAKAMSEALGITQKKAKDYIDSVNSIAKMIANDRVRLDYEASPGRSSFVSNAEYGGSIDFSTICKKRRLFTGTFEAIQRALPNTALTAEEFLEIRSMMDEKGYEVSCGLCYVEGSRAKMGQYTKQFLERYAATNPEYVPTMAEMNTATGQEQIRREHPEVYEAYERFMNNYGRLNPTDKAIFASQQKPKMYQMSTAYQGEILNKFGRKSSKVTEKNLNGGLRIQSFSDFEIIHLIDMMQVIMDMSRVGLSGQAYTKVPDFAWALGDTGLKINLSLITKGLDENGKLILDEKEGMSAADAFALRDRYSENVGTILVVYTDDQLKAALADDRIDYIIPFHKSQWKMDQYELMGIPAEAKNFNYEKLQNESYIKPVLKNGKKQRPENFMPNTYWDFNKSGKENAETYLRMCAEDNRRPKFHHLLVDNKDGSYALQPDGSTDGYWKLLIDFKMYDNNGKGVPQRPVRPDFNMEQAYRMLEDYKGGHSRFPAADDVVSEFVEQYKRNHPGEQYSLSDEYEGTNPELAYLPWENQVYLALSGKFNDLIRSDGYTEDGKRLNSVLYVAKEPTALLQEAGLSDLPLIMTQQHLRSIVSQRWDSENPDRVVNWHNHEINPELVKKVPEFIRKPVAIFRSEGKQVGGLVILTPEFDSHGNPICVFINPDQPSFTYDGAVGPAHFVNMYGLEKFDQFLQRAINNDGIIYQDKKMGQHPAVRDTQTKGVSSGEGLTSAYNTIVREKDPTVKPGERQFSLTDEEYLSAVERGDMETAQRMVDDAAKAAGYNLEGYHGTAAHFNEFKYGDIGYHIGTEAQAKSRVATTGLRPGIENPEPRVMRLYAKINNPLRTAFDFGDWEGWNTAAMLVETEQWEEGYDKNAAEINARLNEIVNMTNSRQADRALVEFLKSLGYDGIVYENQFEAADRTDEYFDGEYDDSYIAFDSDQLKYADPVTYDNNGKVIPLSKRFDSSNEDIRYSLADDDELTAAMYRAFDAIVEQGTPAAPTSQADSDMTGFVVYNQSVGAAALRFDPYTYLLNEYGAIEQTGSYHRVADVPKSTNGKDKVTKTTTTVMGAKVTPESRLTTIAEAVVDGELSYEPITNKVTENRMRRKLIRNGWDDSIKDWTQAVHEGKASADLVAMGATLLNNAGNSGMDGKAYIRLMSDYAQLLNNAGQTLQAANILKKMTPEGKLYAIQKQIDQMNESESESEPRHNTGLPVSLWMDEVGELLADEIYRRVDVKESRESVKSVADTILDDLYRYAKELVAKESPSGKSKQRTEMERLHDMFHNKDKYEEAWQVAKNRLKDEFGDNPEMYAALENWLNSELTTADKLTDILTGQKDIVMDEALAERYLNAKTEDEREAVMEAILQNLADQVPASWVDKFQAWRYTAMLGNLRTPIRNTLGNTVMGVTALGKRAFAGIVEAGMQKAGILDERTTSLLRDKETLAAAKDDFKAVKDLIAGGGKYKDGKDQMNLQTEIKKRQRVFKNAALEGWRTSTQWIMENDYFGDAAFSRATYADALARYMAANGTTWSQASEELKDKARTVAIREAAEATFRDTNHFSQMVSGIGKVRHKDNKAEKAIHAVVEGTLPFKKTPANILVRATEYSPAGLVNGVIQAGVKAAGKGDVSANEIIDNLCKGLTGSAILGLGMLLADLGLLQGSAPDDEKEKELWEMQGHQKYAIEFTVAGKQYSYTIDWVSPVSIPLLVGAELYEAMQSKGLTKREMTSVGMAIFDPMLEMSMLQGLNDALSNAQTWGDEAALTKFVGNAIWGYMTQFIPTLLGQAERASANTRMTTYADKNRDIPDGFQRLVGRASAKIPGIDVAQTYYMDAWGRTQANASNATMNYIEQFLSPGYANAIVESDMEKELLRLKQATGESGVLIASAPKYFNVDKVRKDLTAAEYLTYAKTRGQTAYSLLTEMTAGTTYNGMPDGEKVYAVERAYDYSNQIAKELVTGGKYAVEKWVGEARTLEAEYGVDVTTYLTAYASTKDMSSLKDKGETVDNSLALRKADYVLSVPGLTDEQRVALADTLGCNQTVLGWLKRNPKIIPKKLEAMEKKFG